MSYIYDIVLNFNKDYYEFFEWKKSDKIINVKKIPAFKVSSNDIRSLKYNCVKVDKSFLDIIYELTLFYNKMNFKYMCLVSDSNETLGLMFDSDGNLVKKSSLIFDEEEEVNEEISDNNLTEIKYIYNKKIDFEFISRSDKEKRDYLYKFICELDVNRDEDIFRYMHYDCYEFEEEDIIKIKEKLLKEIKGNNFDKNKLCELVKMFKKIKN